MSAQPQPGGLSQAQSRIARLLHDLESTVESVEELTRAGAHEDALRVVEGQRASLYSVVDSIAHDVSAPAPRWHRARRSAGVLGVAAAFLVSSLALAAVVSRSGPGADGAGVADVRDRIARAEATNDVSARLERLAEAYRLAQQLPPQDAAEADIAGDLARMLEQTQNDLENNPQPGTVSTEAERVRREQPPRAPSPSQDPDDPITSLTDLVRPGTPKRPPRPSE